MRYIEIIVERSLRIGNNELQKAFDIDVNVGFEFEFIINPLELFQTNELKKIHQGAISYDHKNTNTYYFENSNDLRSPMSLMLILDFEADDMRYIQDKFERWQQQNENKEKYFKDFLQEYGLRNLLNEINYENTVSDIKVEIYDEYFLVHEYDFDDDPELVNDFYDVSKQQLSKLIKNKLNVTTSVPKNEEEVKGTSSRFWRIVGDISIESSLHKGEMGVELVSPVFSDLNDAINKLQEVLNFIDNYGRTNDTTALHITLSRKNNQNNFSDILKAGLLLNDEYINKLFNRENEKFTQNIRKIIKNGFIESNYTKEDVEKLSNMEFYYKSFLFLKRQKKYKSLVNKDLNIIEFRSIGGENYHKRYKDIYNSLLRIVYIFGVATDPEFGHEEFLKKLYKLKMEVIEELESRS